MPTYLVQKGTGLVYMFSTIMAERDDMEIVEAPDLSSVGKAIPAKVDVKIDVEAAATAKEKKPTKAKKDTEAPPVEATGLTDLFGEGGE